MELRRVRPEEVQPLFTLRLKGLAADPTAFGTSVEDEVRRGIGFFDSILRTPGADNLIFGAFVDGEIVGMAGIYRTDQIRNRHRASLWGMYVDADYRGKGIAGGLLDLAISHARDQMAVLSVGLTLESGNTTAKRLYESRSFKWWGTEPKSLAVEGKYYDEDHMRLEFDLERADDERHRDKGAAEKR